MVVVREAAAERVSGRPAAGSDGVTDAAPAAARRRTVLSACAFVLAIAGLCGSAAAWPQGQLEWRTGFVECGQAQIRARAQCYEGTSLCVSETLSFARRTGRVIQGLHAHASLHAHPAEGKVKALDYNAGAWACVPGKNAGSYLMVTMAHAAGRDCTHCEYARLYDLNGRLIAADLAFRDSGTARVDEKARRLIRSIVAEPDAGRSRAVYR